MTVPNAKRRKELEAENAKFKRLLAGMKTRLARQEIGNGTGSGLAMQHHPFSESSSSLTTCLCYCKT
jgi:hypothetical protein